MKDIKRDHVEMAADSQGSGKTQDLGLDYAEEPEGVISLGDDKVLDTGLYMDDEQPAAAETYL
jgi:hypothetical protein